MAIATNEDWELGRILWSYHLLQEPPDAADVIVILGSNDLRVATYGAKLWRRGIAPVVVASGCNGNFTQEWPSTEARLFADELIGCGVPREAVLLEEEAKNTADNIRLSLELLRNRSLPHEQLVFVQKPFMERRTRATADVICPNLRYTVTSPQIAYDQYPNAELPRHHILTAMVGDLDRIVHYGELGYQSRQPMPPDVVAASKELKRRGYDGHALF